MGLLEQIEEDKAKLKEMLDGEIVEDEDDIVVDDDAEQDKTDDEEEPAANDDDQKDEPKKEEKPLEGKDYARMRRERREARKAEIAADEAARFQTQQPELQPDKEKPKAVDSDPEPDRATRYPEWLEWSTRQANAKADKLSKKLEEIEQKEQEKRLIDSAVDDFTAIEQEFKKIEPAYDAAAEFYLTQMSKSLKLLYPTATKAQIAETIKMQVLNKAAAYHAQGLDPAEELFEEAVSLGFSPSEEKKTAPKEEKKPDMDKLSENRKRNAGMAGGGSNPKKLTLSVAANMTTGEWKNLSKAEKDAFLKGR